ncbi:MAG: hypothetical protein ACOC8L_14655 [Spirochaetota bacterium]
MAGAIKVSRGGVYVPEWGNADRGEDEKITVHYRFLGFAEQQELLRPDDVGKNFAYEARVVARMVQRIENLSIDDGGGVRAIKDGEALVAEPGVDELALELWLHFRSLTAVDKKKSISESASGTKAKRGKASSGKLETGGSES